MSDSSAAPVAPATATAAGIATAGDAAPKPRVVSLYNPANAVTASRFLCLPPFAWAVDSGHHQWATLFILICGVLDKVDGLVARVFDCRSPFGEMFDAITDGICYAFALILVAAYGWAPVLPVVLIIALGLLNTGMRGIYTKRAGRTVNYKSYAMERIVAYTGYLVGFATAGFEVEFYYWVFVPLMAIIIAHDTRRMLFDPIPAPPAAGAR
jgi:phosphatidylglycerophosphate synthase